MLRGLLVGGRSLLQGAALCLGIVGCAAQHDDSLRLSEELGRARADAAWQQSRAAELEARVSRLEQRATETARAGNAQEDKVLLRLDQLLEMNQSLLASRTTAPLSNWAAATPSLPDGVAATPPQAKSSPVKVAAAMSTPPDAQLRALVESMRGRPGRLGGTLTREQEDALRVLLRTERALDSENPYPAFY
jgi:hypothetical protein